MDIKVVAARRAWEGAARSLLLTDRRDEPTFHGVPGPSSVPDTEP
jgi:hypothetical protein